MYKFSTEDNQTELTVELKRQECTLDWVGHKTHNLPICEPSPGPIWGIKLTMIVEHYVP